MICVFVIANNIDRSENINPVTVPNIRKIHQVETVESNKVKIRNLTCLCKPDCELLYGQCENKKYVRPPDIFSLKEAVKKTKVDGNVSRKMNKRNPGKQQHRKQLHQILTVWQVKELPDQ